MEAAGGEVSAAGSIRPWRLIETGAEDGAWNMAVDRAILRARDEELVPPTLRLYGWRRPTVSLGRFQPAEHVDAAACRELGVDVVRRPTGGRGVLHDAELTYAVVAGRADGVPSGTAESYAYLCEALAAAYRTLGVEADLTSRNRGDRDSASCYLHATRADLSIGAAKLSGSAQVWMRDTVLQHGSFVVARDVEREARVFGLSRDATERLRATTRTLEELMGAAPTAQELREAVIGGFERSLGVTFEAGELTATEVEWAAGWAAESRVDAST